MNSDKQHNDLQEAQPDFAELRAEILKRERNAETKKKLAWIAGVLIILALIYFLL